MNEEFKTCPFCGSSAEVRTYREDINFVQCKQCKAMTTEYPTIEEAIKAWSKRNTFLAQLKRYIIRRLKAWQN